MAVFTEIPGRRDQCIKDALFRRVQCPFFVTLHFCFAQHLDGHIRQITNDGFHVAADVADFGEFGGLHFQKRGIGQFCEAPGNLGFTHTRGTDHQDVLGSDLIAQAAVQLHPAPAISQGDSHRPLGFFLAHDVFVELVDNLTGSHCRHGRSGSVVFGEHFKGAIVVGVDTNIGGDIQTFLDYLVGGQVCVFQQGPG